MIVIGKKNAVNVNIYKDAVVVQNSGMRKKNEPEP